MVFDTDVIIWVLRGSTRASNTVDRSGDRAISIITYMELLQGARNKDEIRTIQRFLRDLDFRTLPLTENIGHRASIYMEEYALSVAMSMADALIAATVVENGEQLTTGNQRHYRAIEELRTKQFRPTPGR